MLTNYFSSGIPAGNGNTSGVNCIRVFAKNVFRKSLSLPPNKVESLHITIFVFALEVYTILVATPPELRGEVGCAATRKNSIR